MDTIVNAVMELIFYFVENYFFKPREEIKQIQLTFKPVEKSGVLIIPRKNKAPLYSIKLPDQDILLENIEFESTTDVGIGTELNIIGRKEKETIFFVDPVEIYSQNFFNDILEFLNKRKVKK